MSQRGFHQKNPHVYELVCRWRTWRIRFIFGWLITRSNKPQ